MKLHWGVVAVAALSACGSHPHPQTPADQQMPAEVKSGERSIATTEVPRTIVTPHSANSINELYAQAQRQFDAENWVEAARAFDRVYELDPNGQLAAEALYQAAHAHDEAGALEPALKRYTLFSKRFPRHRLVRTSLVRQIRLLTHLEMWSRAGEVAGRLLADERAGGPFELIVAYSGKALALLAEQKHERAAYYIAKARNIVEQHHLDRAGELPRDLARLYFALGELKRLKAEELDFEPLPDDFGVYLEKRCQLLLDAQSAYSNAMRAQDAHWSAMAGYRVGELYQSLHQDLMSIPVPSSAGTKFRQDLFEGAMRLRYAILLTKADSMMEHTLRMAERTGESNEWVERARRARESIAQAMKSEQAALDRLPYTRGELQAALDHLRDQQAKQEGAM